MIISGKPLRPPPAGSSPSPWAVSGGIALYPAAAVLLAGSGFPAEAPLTVVPWHAVRGWELLPGGTIALSVSVPGSADPHAVAAIVACSPAVHLVATTLEFFANQWLLSRGEQCIVGSTNGRELASATGEESKRLVGNQSEDTAAGGGGGEETAQKQPRSGASTLSRSMSLKASKSTGRSGLEIHGTGSGSDGAGAGAGAYSVGGRSVASFDPFVTGGGAAQAAAAAPEKKAAPAAAPSVVPPGAGALNWPSVVRHCGWLLMLIGDGSSTMFGNTPASVEHREQTDGSIKTTVVPPAPAGKAWVRKWCVLYSTAQGSVLVGYHNPSCTPLHTEVPSAPLEAGENAWGAAVAGFADGGKVYNNHTRAAREQCRVDLAAVISLRPVTVAKLAPKFGFDLVSIAGDVTLGALTRADMQVWLQLLALAVDEDVAMVPDGCSAYSFDVRVVKVVSQMEEGGEECWPPGIPSEAEFQRLRRSALHVRVSELSMRLVETGGGRTLCLGDWFFTDLFSLKWGKHDSQACIVLTLFTDADEAAHSAAGGGGFRKTCQVWLQGPEPARFVNALELMLDKFMTLIREKVRGCWRRQRGRGGRGGWATM
jgi:hypothetical protein